MAEHTGLGDNHPRHRMFPPGPRRDGIPDSDGVNQHYIDNLMSQFDGGAGHIINSQTNPGSAGATNGLPSWYCYGVIATSAIGILIFLIVRG